MNVNKLDVFTFKEGDLKLGRLSRVLDLRRASDGINASVITENRVKAQEILLL